MIFFTYGAFKVMAFLKCRFCLAHLTLLLSHLCTTQVCNVYTQLHIMPLKKITENEFRPIQFLVLEGQHNYSFELNSPGLCNRIQVHRYNLYHQKSSWINKSSLFTLFLIQDYIKTLFFSVPSDYCRTYKNFNFPIYSLIHFGRFNFLGELFPKIHLLLLQYGIYLTRLRSRKQSSSTPIFDTA